MSAVHMDHQGLVNICDFSDFSWFLFNGKSTHVGYAVQGFMHQDVHFTMDFYAPPKLMGENRLNY